jgi:hypothetical protein
MGTLGGVPSDTPELVEWEGLRLPAADAAALERAYRALAAALASLPEAELKAVEPALRSLPADAAQVRPGDR